MTLYKYQIHVYMTVLTNVSLKSNGLALSVAITTQSLLLCLSTMDIQEAEFVHLLTVVQHLQSDPTVNRRYQLYITTVSQRAAKPE